MLSNSKNRSLDQRSISDETQAVIPTGVLTFEDATSKFDGNPAVKGNKELALTLVILVICTFFEICFCFAYPDKWLVITIIMVIFAAVLITGTLYLGSSLVETPYGKIYSSSSSVLYPKINAYNGRVDSKFAKFQEDLGVRYAAQDFYKNQIKKNPELWLKYMFYREQAEKLENITKALPQPPVVEQEQLEWYKSQRDHYYDLFINTKNEVAQ